MILPSGTSAMMELKNGFLCGAHNCAGTVPLLGTTEALLERLGFQIREDIGDIEPINACVNPLVALADPSEIDTLLSEVVLRALDDIRVLRHRVEEDCIPEGKLEAGKGSKTARQTRRDRKMNNKVDSLERQRAKLQEKKEQQQQDPNFEVSIEEEEVEDAWTRLARTYNSVRLVLYLFSMTEGLGILGQCPGENSELKSIPKIVAKISDAMALLETSCTLSNTNTGEENSRNEDEESHCNFPQRVTLSNWERFIRMMATATKQTDPCEIELTDDSSVESVDNNDSDKPKKRPSIPIIPDDVSACFRSWNVCLDKRMQDVLVAMTKRYDRGDELYMFVIEQSFGALGLNGNKDTTDVPHDRGRRLDDQFSLVVGLAGGKEYRTREKYLFSIEKLRSRIENRIKLGNHGRYRDAQLEVYGSCLSGLSLGKNADVDLSLTFSEAIISKRDFESGDLPAKKYNRFVTDTVFQIKRKLERGGPYGEEFKDLQAIARARVPVIKGIYMGAGNPHSEDGSLPFDICLLNDIAVSNSGLIKEYSDVDVRVKSLMIAIKQWTKDNKINSAQDNTLSSYTWMNMAIYYLQCIGFVPNLQCPVTMKECNYDSRRNPRRDNINNLDTAYLKWKGQAESVWKRDPRVDETYSSVSMLLYGFFRFYSHEFPMHLYMVSIKRGGAVRFPKTMFSDRTSLHLCIEDPFETYDSHFPHDLGSPADERGSLCIMQCFRNSEEHLREILFGDDDDEEVSELWPVSKPPEANDSSARRRNRRTKRDKSMTLFIEAITPMNKDAIIEMFQPFADQTKSFIVGSSVIQKGYVVFVDYDSDAAVLAALAAHAKRAFRWEGTTLYIEQNSKKATNSAKRKRKKVLEGQRKPHVATEQRENEPDDDVIEIEEGEINEKDEEVVDNTNEVGKSGVVDDTNENGNDGKGNTTSKKEGRPQRDGEKVLVIKNIGKMKKKDTYALFQPFAKATRSKIVACDLVKKGSVLFVDYDSVDAVHAALAHHAKTPLEWNGLPLDVSQKSSSNRPASKPNKKKAAAKKKKPAEKAKIQAKKNSNKTNTPNGQADPALGEEHNRNSTSPPRQRNGGRGYGRSIRTKAKKMQAINQTE